jgi:arsenite/tail-anchored protein-transporting ATPase
LKSDFQEIDPAKSAEDNQFLKSMGISEDGEGTMSEIMSSIPGIDEATSFGEVIKMVNEMKFSLVIFDTAPTGHTLRFLNFPNILDKALVKMVQIKEKAGPMLSQLSSMMGGGGDEGSITKILDKAEDLKNEIQKIDKQFKDPKQTTFVAV